MLRITVELDGKSVDEVSHSTKGRLSGAPGNVWAEQFLKLAYWFYSFTFGESISIWLLPVTVVLALPCLLLFVSGARLHRDWLWPAFLTATIAYLGATRWVSYPYIGSRLLFLLPLFILAMAAGVTTRHRLGTTLGVLLLAANLAGLCSYYRARGLLTASYLVPNQRIVTEIVQHSRTEDTVVWVDGLNSDVMAFEYYLPKSFRVRWLTSPESVAAARAELNAGTIRHVWFVRSSHDISPGHEFEKLQSQMTETWIQHSLHPYVPISPVHVAILRVLALLRHQDGSQPRQYMCEVWEFQGPR